MNGKVCIVTGANNGFGFETSRELAQRGAQVVMLCRSQSRGEKAQAAIEAKTGHKPTLLLADLSSQAQVKSVAAAFREKFDRLDVLLNNAGFDFKPRQVTKEGFEKTFALNYLGYFTLILELADMLVASSPARIVNTSSEAHRWGPFDFENLQGEKDFPNGKFGLTAMYGWSNVYRIMLTYTLARKLKSVGVTANTFCPGPVPVKRSEVAWYFNMLVPLLRLMPSMRSVEEAAEQMIALATSDEYQGKSGLYFSSGNLVSSADYTYDEEVQERLWKTTLSLTGYEDDPLAKYIV